MSQALKTHIYMKDFKKEMTGPEASPGHFKHTLKKHCELARYRCYYCYCCSCYQYNKAVA